MTTESEVDETQGIQGTNSEQTPLVAPRTPLPKLQLFIVYLCFYAEPITGTCIYPFAPQFVRSTGITGGDEKKTGYYAGIVESIFYVTEFLSVYPWATMSNYVGRRPVLLIGPLGLSVAMVCFGFSSTFWQLVLFRGFQGSFNGGIGVGKTVVAELSDKTNIAYAFSFEPAMWCTGIILGPLIGGIFAEPAKEFPGTIGKLKLFQSFPYLLPCLIAGGLAFSFFVVAFIGLQETYPRYKRRSRAGRDSGGYDRVSDTLSDSPPEGCEPEPHVSLRDVFTRRLGLTLLNYGTIAFMEMSVVALTPLMFSTSIESGGLGLSSTEIGIVLGLRGIIGACLPFFFAPIIQRNGPRIVFIWTFFGSAVGVMLFPLLALLADTAQPKLLWVVIVLQVILTGLNVVTYSSIQVILVDNASSKPALAKINSIAQMTSTSVRSFSPIIVSSLYALSVERDVLGGYMVYLVLFAVLAVGMKNTYLLPNDLQNLKSH